MINGGGGSGEADGIDEEDGNGGENREDDEHLAGSPFILKIAVVIIVVLGFQGARGKGFYEITKEIKWNEENDTDKKNKCHAIIGESV